MSLAIDGLISGLDTTSLIDSLMRIEAVPQTLLKNKVSASQNLISALQSLNGKVATLTAKAGDAAEQDALRLYRATSSSDGVSVTVSGAAGPGALDLRVDRLAQAQVLVSAPLAGWPDSPVVLTVVGASGATTEITAASASLDDIVHAVNSAGAGVRALKVASGLDGEGAPLYRLQLTSTQSGAQGAFSVYRGSAAEVAAGEAADLLSDPGASSIRSAQDAEVTLWAGTAAEQTVASPSNAFTELLPGVTLTASAVSADPVTVSIERDDSGIAAVASGLVAALNAVFAEISVKSAVTTSTDPNGSTSIKGGVFTSDGTVRQAGDSLLSAVIAPVEGRSPAEIGISLTRTGQIEFDADAFQAALSEDEGRTTAMLQEIASRLAVAGAQASDKYDGSLTRKIAGQESIVKDLGTRISDWDSRLANQRATLERTYAALEVQLSRLQSQSSWLASQLGTLPASTGASQ